MKIGYACINLTLPCTSSSTFRLRNFSDERFLEIVKKNLNCLTEILYWNQDKKIKFFRISSGLIPFADHPVCKIEWQKIFQKEFAEIGRYIKKNKMRVSMHPDHFTILNSKDEKIVQKAIKTLEYHNDILDLLEVESTNKIQIHVGGVYGDKEKSKERFIENYKKLPLKIKKRLVLENDDRSFSLKDCLDISKEAGIPLVFDVFHHSLLNNGESLKKATSLASKTWKKEDGHLMIDFSSQSKEKRRGAHADYLEIEDFNSFLKETKNIKKDVMLETKNKEKTLFFCGFVV